MILCLTFQLLAIGLRGGEDGRSYCNRFPIMKYFSDSQINESTIHQLTTHIYLRCKTPVRFRLMKPRIGLRAQSKRNTGFQPVKTELYNSKSDVYGFIHNTSQKYMTRKGNLMPFSDLSCMFGVNCIGTEFISGNLQLPLYETLPSQIELQIRNRQQAELQIPLNSLGIKVSLVLVRQRFRDWYF